MLAFSSLPEAGVAMPPCRLGAHSVHSHRHSHAVSCNRFSWSTGPRIHERIDACTFLQGRSHMYCIYIIHTYFRIYLFMHMNADSLFMLQLNISMHTCTLAQSPPDPRSGGHRARRTNTPQPPQSLNPALEERRPSTRSESLKHTKVLQELGKGRGRCRQTRRKGESS